MIKIHGHEKYDFLTLDIQIHQTHQVYQQGNEHCQVENTHHVTNVRWHNILTSVEHAT